MSSNYPSAFVSSTYEDLKDHRTYVINQLRHCGVRVDPMEDWDAAPDRPTSFSTRRIEGCDLFVLLVGNRLGHIPKGEVRSITQIEYDYAQTLGIDVLPFMLTKQNPYISEAQDGDIAVQTWRDEIRERHGVGFFTRPAESVPVATSVARWLISRRLPLPTNLSLTSILADRARTKDVRGFFSGRLDLVKLAFVHQFGGEHVVPDFKIGNMHFDYAVVSPVVGSSNKPSSILYVSLRDPEDTLLEGAIGKEMEEIDRFLGERYPGDGRGEMIEEALASREDYRDLARTFFYHRAVLVGGRRNSLSKKELEIMRNRNAEPGSLEVKTWDTIAEHLDGLLATAHSIQ